MRQQLVDAARWLCWEALKDIFEVSVRDMAFELGGLDRANADGSTPRSRCLLGELAAAT
jgi:hypothetical protein